MSYAGKPYPSPVPVASPRQANNQLGTVSLVLGLLSLFLGCPFAIGALITGWMGMKREPSGMARAGFILGLVMTLVNAAVVLTVLVVVGGLVGLGVYVDSQEASRSYPSYSDTAYPAVELPTPYSGGDPYALPEVPIAPASMPERMTPPTFPTPEIPAPYIPPPYVPPPYVPPPMPGVGPSSFPQPPGYSGPGRFSPPTPFGPSGAFPPGLGPPVSVEPADGSESRAAGGGDPFDASSP